MYLLKDENLKDIKIDLFKENNNIILSNMMNNNIKNLLNYIKNKDVENIYKVMNNLKENDIDLIKINDNYFKTIDLKYIIDDIIDENENLIKYHYNYNKIVEIFKDIYNIEDVEIIKEINNFFNITIDVINKSLIFNNKEYYFISYLFDEDFIRDLNKYMYQIVNRNFNYHLINFDDIFISSLSYFYNIYSYNYNTIDNIIENNEISILNEDVNIEILKEKYNIEIYYNFYHDDNNYDNLLNDLYENIFNENLNDFLDNENDIFYKNKTLFINKDYLKKLNDENDNEIYFISYYSNEIRYNYELLFEILLKDLNEDIDYYIDTIEILDENIFNNTIIIINDYNIDNFEIKIDSYDDLYLYVKYYYNYQLEKNDLFNYDII